MSGPAIHREDQRIAREAAEWVILHDRGPTVTEQRRLESWLGADPRHRSAYERRCREWAMLSAASLLRDTESPPAAIRRRRMLRRPFWLGIGGGALAAACLAFWLSSGPNLPERAVTEMVASLPVSVVERRVLAEGSIIDLAEGADVEVALTADQRTVRMRRGSVHFVVAHDPGRPFVVEVADTYAIRAIGTAFQVHLLASGIQVDVTEGRVRVESRREVDDESTFSDLGVGERLLTPLTAKPGAAVIVAFDPNSTRDPAAPQRLEFEAAPLGSVVAEINRMGNIRLVIEDPEIEAMPVYASLTNRNVESLVGLLEATGVLVVQRSDGTIRIGRPETMPRADTP